MMKKIYKLRFLGITLIFVLSCLFVIKSINVDAKANFKTKKTIEKSDRDKLKDAVFEKDGIIYLYNENMESITPISQINEKVYNPELSPNDENIAFIYEPLESENYALEIGIINLTTNNIANLIVDNKYSNQITDLQWINENKIGVEGHVNPSTSEFFVYDTASGEELKRYVGSMFTLLPDRESILYKGFIPFGWEEDFKETYYIEDELIYEANNNEVTLGYPQLTPQYNKLVFIENNKLDESMELVVCDFDLDSKKAILKSKIGIDENIYGDLLFSTSEDIYIVNDTDMFEANLKNNRFDKYETKKNIEYDQEKEQKFNKFDKALKYCFKNDQKYDRVVVNNVDWY